MTTTAQNVALLTGSDLVTAAKNIRKELAAAFPGVKFSVTSSRFSGGDSIRIDWTDGPITKRVEEITCKYQEGSFDGMTDSYNYNQKEARAWTNKHGGSKYVQTQRQFSDAHVARAIAAVAEKYGATTVPTVEDFQMGKAWGVSPTGEKGHMRNDWQSLIGIACSETEG